MVKDLTEGKPFPVLLRFTLPMFVGVVFQQLYNIADSVIAGRFAGENALAAVGASYPVTMIFMAIAIGSQIGCSVVVSRFFGAKRYKTMKTAVFTTLIAGSILAAGLTAAGILTSRLFMTLLHTPENIFRDGDLYLKIYVGGFLFLYLYNVATGIFNSLGDSRTPLYFLICSSIGNVFLDWLFVAVFKWGVAGVAWATFLAQGVACVLSLVVLARRLSEVKTTGSFPLFDRGMLANIAVIAVPSILQQSFISIGNMFVQGLVNSFGSSVIAGYSAAVKLNTFTITCFTTLGNGISSFTAQNIGAGKKDRVNAGWQAGMVFGLVTAALFFGCYFGFSGSVLKMFMNESSSALAMETGRNFLRIVTPFYFIACVKLVSDGVLRGSGAMGCFMISTFTDLVLRVVLAFVFSLSFRETGIWMSWPVGWLIGTSLSFIFYKSGVWKKKRGI